MRAVTVAALVSAVTLWGMSAAQASISSPGPSGIADAIKASGTVVTGASYALVPPDGTPNGVSDSAMGGFPTAGSTFAILTTTDVNFADDVPEPGVNDNIGGNINGTKAGSSTAFDVSILKIDFTVGAGMNCLRFDFRFFTEEYDDFVGLEFNDAFIAELDASTWSTSGSVINAPGNFAFDAGGNVISVNSTGDTSMAPAPPGTIYDGATPLLTAAHAVTPGAHSLYLSIFDQGDHLVDSAAFVDNFVIGHAANPQEQCTEGAEPKHFELALTPAAGSNPVGTAHTVTATLKDLSPAGPIEDGAILFSVAGANTAGGSGATDATGMATFSYTGTHAGTDTITACYDADASDACEGGEPFLSVTKTWVEPADEGDDGNGGLPITGRATGLLAGAGALILLLGVAGYLLLRRRRVRFIAE